MKRKTAGELNAPPSQAEFDLIPLDRFCRKIPSRTFLRLHSTNLKTGAPWAPLHFSVKGTTRFDPVDGTGTLYVAFTLGGALMEVFDGRWGAVGTSGRSLTQMELREWWVSLVNLPAVSVFDATGGNLSKLGTDAQLLSGDYTVSRQWALRLMAHPHQPGGILFPSRHDPSRSNLALFHRPGLLPAHYDAALTFTEIQGWKKAGAHRGHMVHGPAVRLAMHPELDGELCELEVSLLP